MDDEWVQVTNCNWLHEAHFITSVLNAEGIEAFVPDAYTVGANPILATALGGIRVLVHAADLDRARAALAAVKEAGRPDDGN